MTKVQFAESSPEHHGVHTSFSVSELESQPCLNLGLLKANRVYRCDFSVASEEDAAVRCNQENITVAEIPNRKNCFSVHAETNEAGSLERSFTVAIGAKEYTLSLLATVMGTRTGTPMLREGVRMVGKGSLAESDVETDWQAET